MNFTPHELSRLALLRDLAADFCSLSGELKLAQEHLPQLAEIERTTQEAMSFALPSQIIGDAPAVQSARQRHNDAAFKRGALREAQSRVETRLAVLLAQVKRELSELIPALRKKIRADLPQALARLDDLPGEPAARSAALIALCVELGAALPVAPTPAIPTAT